jgi:endogenous inhibitor of DNA gyrase (YacG/DUF329 family)
VQARCPTCGNPFEFDDSPAKPFCSERCRLIDLGGWLNETHSIPVIRKEEDDDGERREEMTED